jgi:hypothetical protein
MAMKQGIQSGAAATSTSNPTYNVISVLYHALQGASNCEQYMQDAESGEVQQFFQEAMQTQRELAEKAKQLLGIDEQRLSSKGASKEVPERSQGARH